MDVVLFYSGKELPTYLEYTFKQIRLFNPNATVYFLTDSHLVEKDIFFKYDVWALDKDFFYSDKIAELEVLLGRKKDDFWTITATRLIYIENFLRAYELKNVYHFENDVLLYYDLHQYHELFKSLYQNLAITTGGPDKSMTGFLFIKDHKALTAMTYFFKAILNKRGLQGVRERYKMDMVHEMSLMKAYEKETSRLSNLPILPFGEHGKSYDAFESIFDPASWGQFVGGTTDGIPGAKPPDHYIGRVLIANPEYTVIWKTDDEDRKIPYFKYDDNEVRINNLHIHSKNLHLYMSKDD